MDAARRTGSARSPADLAIGNEITKGVSVKQRAVAAVLVACWLSSSVQAQTFRRVETERRFNRIQVIIGVADLNGDGRDDVIAGGQPNDGSETVEDRLNKLPVRVFLGTRGGQFQLAPAGMLPSIRARTPTAVTDDFNADGHLDFAVFDAGVYVWAESSGYGNPPQLFLSTPSGQFLRSEALADAVRLEHRERPPPGPSPNLADLHIKSATSGDIDSDGDVDLWVQSGGGANVEEHFLVNNGDGTFTVDRDNRATRPVLHNQPPDGSQYWGWDGGHFVDIDNDGDLDLALGHIRDRGPHVINQFNTVLVNDGAGYYPSRIDLPRVRFFEGFTAVAWLTHFDVNDDGFADLFLMNTRNDDVDADALAWTGRYIQVLVNRRVPLPGGGVWFGDETDTWVKGQGATTPERLPNGDPLHNGSAGFAVHDVDRDGCADLVMVRQGHRVSREAPLVYRNNGSGQFRPMSPAPFLRADMYFGDNAAPADVNGDGAVDFVELEVFEGPDGVIETGDDFGVLVTLLNTTPARAPRCVR